MTLRLVEIILSSEHERTLQKAMEKLGVSHAWNFRTPEEQCIYHFVTDARDVQRIVDVAQTLIEHSEQTRVTVLPVELALPSEVASRKPLAFEERRRSSASLTREELRAKLNNGAQLDVDYGLMVFLSTVVAVIGLIADNEAVLVGAMVIAPFLGPNLALAFATTMGDYRMGVQALKTLSAGLGLVIVLSTGLALVWPNLPATHEMAARTAFGPEALVLAVASGGAAVLSLTGATPMSLVGVMVAVALLPPATVVGLKLGVGDFMSAEGAALLLLTNIIGLNLAANAVFSMKGISPRHWAEKDAAQRTRRVTFALWGAALVLVVLLTQRHNAFLPPGSLRFPVF